MAILGKIRERSIFLIFIIGMALLAFVFTGVFDGNNTQSQEPVLIVGDAEVGIETFSQRVDFAERSYGMTQMQAVNFAFEQSTNEKVFDQTFEDLALEVGKNHIELYLKSDPNFSSDPQFVDENGTFDPQKFTDFILDLRQNNPQGFEQWKAQESSIKNNIRVENYFDMVNAGLNVTNFEAQQEYALQNNLVDIEYVRIPLATVADSLFTTTDKDVESYIKNNSKNYEQDASRSVRYVKFDVVPTPEDKLLIENELRNLINDRSIFNEVSKQEEIIPSLANVLDSAIASYVNEYSEVPYSDTFVSESEISGNYANTLFKLSTGTVFGPYEDNGYSKLTKMIAKRKNGKAKARHILLAYKGAARAQESVTRSKSQARKEAYALLRKARRGNDFSQLARENSDGPSGPNGGELPEFTKEDMVTPFSDFVFRNRKGAKGVVETEFGYHVIEVLDKKDVVKLATISKKLIPSDATANQIYTEASQFEFDLKETDFLDLAKQKNIAVREVNDLKILDETFPGLGNQRQAVQWAFEEDRKVSDVKRFSYNTDGFIIVQLISSKAEGVASAADVSDEVPPLVIKEKKKKYITDQIENYTSLEEVADQFGQALSSAKAVNRFTAMLAGASQEPKVVGAAFSTLSGAISKPIAGNTGIYVIKTTATNPAEAMPSYAGFRASLENNSKQNVQQSLAVALKSKYTIVDNRRLYY
jgi:peptidyl-prolyl cis-trans isomerase D